MARFATATAEVAREFDLGALRQRARRARRRADRGVPWPGDVAPDDNSAPGVEDVPAWINGPRSRARRVLGLALTSTLLLDLACVIMHVSA